MLVESSEIVAFRADVVLRGSESDREVWILARCVDNASVIVGRLVRKRVISWERRESVSGGRAAEVLREMYDEIIRIKGSRSCKLSRSSRARRRTENFRSGRVVVVRALERVVEEVRVDFVRPDGVRIVFRWVWRTAKRGFAWRVDEEGGTIIELV